MVDEEYSQTQETRVLNNTPVKLKLDFEIIDEDYLAGTTVVLVCRTPLDLPIIKDDSRHRCDLASRQCQSSSNDHF